MRVRRRHAAGEESIGHTDNLTLMKQNGAMNQVLTIFCKLKASEPQAMKLDATWEAFVQALNWVNQNTPEQIVNAVKLQSLCYYEVRARFGLSSNLAQQVCRRVAGSCQALVKLPTKSIVW